jgi:hypothetical protein
MELGIQQWGAEMSKRSGMSRLEDLRHKFIDVGRHRYILHKIDMEPWLDKTCPICNKGFTEDPRFSFMSYAIHFGCWESPAFAEWEVQWIKDEDNYDYDGLARAMFEGEHDL